MISRRDFLKRSAQTTILGVAVLSLAQSSTKEVAAYAPSISGASANWGIPEGYVGLKFEDGVVNHLIYDGDGWIPLDGRSLSKAEYPALYNAIGTAYGSRGKRFRIPDVRAVNNLSIGYGRDKR